MYAFISLKYRLCNYNITFMAIMEILSHVIPTQINSTDKNIVYIIQINEYVNIYDY